MDILSVFLLLDAASSHSSNNKKHLLISYRDYRDSMSHITGLHSFSSMLFMVLALKLQTLLG